MRFQNLVIIGTSHIAAQSIKKIKAAFEKYKPGVVAVELDAGRLEALFSGDRRKPGLKDIKRIGVKGYLFAILGAWAEKKMGESVGVAPGEDMMQAVRLASENSVPVALIDQNIDVTLRKFSEKLTWIEKWRFVVDVMHAVAGPRKALPFDLHKVPNRRVVKKLTEQVRKRYPNIYHVLVTERNDFMAKKIATIMQAESGKTVLAIVGAGHEEDIIQIVKKIVCPRRTSP